MKKSQSRFLTRSRWAAIGAAVAVTLGGGGLIGVSANGGTAAVLVPIDPVRILDTRSGPTVGSLDAGGNSAPLRLKVAGAENSGVPSSGVTAVSMNLTAVETRANSFGGYVTVYPCATTSATERPNVSSLNFVSGQTLANAVVAPLSDDGHVCLYVYGVAHLLVDVNGYYTDLATSVDAYTKREIDDLFSRTRTDGNTNVVGVDANGERYSLHQYGPTGWRKHSIYDDTDTHVYIDGLYWRTTNAQEFLDAAWFAEVFYRSSDCSGPAYLPLVDGFNLTSDTYEGGVALVVDGGGNIPGMPATPRRIGLDESDVIPVSQSPGSTLGFGYACGPGTARSSALYRVVDIGGIPPVAWPLTYELEG